MCTNEMNSFRSSFLMGIENNSSARPTDAAPAQRLYSSVLVEVSKEPEAAGEGF